MIVAVSISAVHTHRSEWVKLSELCMEGRADVGVVVE